MNDIVLATSYEYVSLHSTQTNLFEFCSNSDIMSSVILTGPRFTWFYEATSL